MYCITLTIGWSAAIVLTLPIESSRKRITIECTTSFSTEKEMPHPDCHHRKSDCSALAIAKSNGPPSVTEVLPTDWQTDISSTWFSNIDCPTDALLHLTFFQRKNTVRAHLTEQRKLEGKKKSILRIIEEDALKDEWNLLLHHPWIAVSPFVVFLHIFSLKSREKKKKSKNFFFRH